MQDKPHPVYVTLYENIFNKTSDDYCLALILSHLHSYSPKSLLLNT